MSDEASQGLSGQGSVPLQGFLRPDHGQGDAADGDLLGGAAVLGGQTSQEDPEGRIQGSWAGMCVQCCTDLFSSESMITSLTSDLVPFLSCSREKVI